MTREQMINDLIQSYIESSIDKFNVHLPDLRKKDVDLWIRNNPEWYQIRKKHFEFVFVTIHRKDSFNGE